MEYFWGDLAFVNHWRRSLNEAGGVEPTQRFGDRGYI